MSPLQKYPLGLLGLFDLKTLGDAPNRYGDTVQPVFEAVKDYALNLRAVQSAGPSVLNALGQSVTLTVPAGKIWDIEAVSFTAGCLAAALNPNLELNFNGVAVGRTDAIGDVVRANPYEVLCIWQPPQRFLAGPGSTITGLIRSTPNSNLTCLLRAVVSVYDI